MTDARDLTKTAVRYWPFLGNRARSFLREKCRCLVTGARGQRGRVIYNPVVRIGSAPCGFGVSGCCLVGGFPVLGSSGKRDALSVVYRYAWLRKQRVTRMENVSFLPISKHRVCTCDLGDACQTQLQDLTSTYRLKVNALSL